MNGTFGSFYHLAPMQVKETRSERQPSHGNGFITHARVPLTMADSDVVIC